MKITKRVTHYWFVIVSVLSFLAGWGMLAHSLKPISTYPSTQSTAPSTASLPTLQPIQAFGAAGSLGSGTSSSLNLIVPPSNLLSAGSSLLRTGGS